MKSKVLKLCKRLNKATIDEITPILQATRGEICPVLDELVMEGRLELRSDGTYFYKEVEKKKANLPLFFEFRTKDELELIIKCFCADIVYTKTTFIVELGDKIIYKFNQYFRKQIYEKQLQELIELHIEKPYFPRIRKFFDIPVYFYYYNGNTFVSEKPLNAKTENQPLSKSMDKEFRKTYLKLTRRINHNAMESFLYYRIAEELWRMDKDFSTLHDEIAALCS